MLSADRAVIFLLEFSKDSDAIRGGLLLSHLHQYFLSVLFVPWKVVPLEKGRRGFRAGADTASPPHA